MSSSSYFSGQGTLWAAKRNSGGAPQGFVSYGNVSSLVLNLGKGYAQDATLGGELLANAQRPGDAPTFSMTVEELTSDNIAALIYGQNNTVSGTIAGEVLQGFIGKATPLANINLSSFTSLKNAADSVTYTKGTDYLIDLPTGRIDIPATGSTITNGQTLHANYITAAHTKVALGTTAPPFLSVRFEGLNTANGNSPVIVDIYKVKLLPVESMALIGDSIVGLQVTGRIFKDSLISFTQADGQYLRIRQA